MDKHEVPDPPDNGQDSKHEGQDLPGDVVGIVHEVIHEVDLIHEAQDSAHEGQESSDSAYEADTVPDSPTSTSSTFQLNLSLDSHDQNEVNANNVDEDEVQILDEPPALVADHNEVNENHLDDDMQMPLELPAAAAAAAHPIIIRNFDETGFKVCAMHSFKHLHTSCPGCACRCKATNIDGIVGDSESEEDEDPGLYALLADLHERNEEDGESEDED